MILRCMDRGIEVGSRVCPLLPAMKSDYTDQGKREI